MMLTMTTASMVSMIVNPARRVMLPPDSNRCANGLAWRFGAPERQKPYQK
jgi:hypothetical protein